jgi:hypothetical protein
MQELYEEIYMFGISAMMVEILKHSRVTNLILLWMFSLLHAIFQSFLLIEYPPV